MRSEHIIVLLHKTQFPGSFFLVRKDCCGNRMTLLGFGQWICGQFFLNTNIYFRVTFNIAIFIYTIFSSIFTISSSEQYIIV